jgi:hypothetical protein
MLFVSLLNSWPVRKIATLFLETHPQSLRLSQRKPRKPRIFRVPRYALCVLRVSVYDLHDAGEQSINYDRAEGLCLRCEPACKRDQFSYHTSCFHSARATKCSLAVGSRTLVYIGYILETLLRHGISSFGMATHEGMHHILQVRSFHCRPQLQNATSPIHRSGASLNFEEKIRKGILKTPAVK